MSKPMLIEYVPRAFAKPSLTVIETANEILDDYATQGYDLTLRQLYYQFVARGLIANRDSEYKRLGSLVNDARLAGLIPWNRIVDRTRHLRTLGHWDDPAAIIEGAAASYATDKWADQDYRLEVWIEKDALVGVIERVCDELDVPYFSCRGYTSQSEVWGAAMRFVRYIGKDEKRVRVLHLGDHDPSGIDMSRDIEDRLRLFLSTHVGWDLTRRKFGIDRLALNFDQVEEYEPPPNPAKLTDSRAVGYIAEHGPESWELDALEPTVIGDLIRGAVEGYRDSDAWDDAVARQEEDRAGLAKAAGRWAEVASFLNGGGPAS